MYVIVGYLYLWWKMLSPNRYDSFIYIYIYIMDFPVDFYVWVSESNINSNVYDDCEISVQLAISRQDHKWSKSEGCRKNIDGWAEHTLIPDLATFNFSVRFTSKSLILFRMVALYLFLCSAKSSKLPKGILGAERLYFSSAMYWSQVRPVLLFPSFSSLYIRIFVFAHHSFLLHDQPMFVGTAWETFPYLQSHIMRKDQHLSLYLRACIHIYIYIYS